MYPKHRIIKGLHSMIHNEAVSYTHLYIVMEHLLKVL